MTQALKDSQIAKQRDIDLLRKRYTAEIRRELNDIDYRLAEYFDDLTTNVSISPSNKHPGLTSFRIYWLGLLAVQGILKSLHQHHSSKASILRGSAFFTVQLSHPYMTTRNTIALTRWTFVGKVMSLLLNMLSRLVITFLPRSKH